MTIVTLVPPVDVVGRRPRADERSWRLLVFVAGQSLQTTELNLSSGASAEEAQGAAAQVLDHDVTWAPCGRAWRGVLIDVDQITQPATQKGSE